MYSLLNEEGDIMYKAIDIAKWFLQHNAFEQKLSSDVEGISNLKLQKLLYYAQGCYLGVYGSKLFEDDILAWQHGPVVSDVYHEFKKFHNNSITVDVSEIVKVDDKAQKVLEWVYEEFGKYTAWALRNKTHEETPWRTTQPNGVISIDAIRNYFVENYVEA